MYNITEVKHLTIFMMNSIAANRPYFIKDGQIDFDTVAAYVWDNYTSPFDEFMINEAIDLFFDVVETL